MIITPTDKTIFLFGEIATEDGCLLQFWTPRDSIHVSGGITIQQCMGFLKSLTFIVLYLYLDHITRKRSKISGTHGSSFGITAANKYSEHTFYWKLLLSLQEWQQRRRRMSKRSKLMHEPEPWKSSRKEAPSLKMGSQSCWELAQRKLPSQVLLSPPQLAEDEGFLSKGVASENVFLQRHREHPGVEVRSPTENRGIKWQATYWKGNLTPSSRHSASKTLAASISSVEKLINLKERPRWNENWASVSETGGPSPEAHQLTSPSHVYSFQAACLVPY